MPTITVRREIRPSESGETFGSVLDQLLALKPLRGQLVAVRLDLITPSSHSDPAFEVSFRDTPENREAIADFFFDDPAELEFV